MSVPTNTAPRTKPNRRSLPRSRIMSASCQPRVALCCDDSAIKSRALVGRCDTNNLFMNAAIDLWGIPALRQAALKTIGWVGRRAVHTFTSRVRRPQEPITKMRPPCGEKGGLSDKGRLGEGMPSSSKSYNSIHRRGGSDWQISEGPFVPPASGVQQNGAPRQSDTFPRSFGI